MVYLPAFLEQRYGIKATLIDVTDKTKKKKPVIAAKE
jgi:hypothetical protein